MGEPELAKAAKGGGERAREHALVMGAEKFGRGWGGRGAWGARRREKKRIILEILKNRKIENSQSEMASGVCRRRFKKGNHFVGDISTS